MNNFLDDRESQTRAAWLSRANERVEQRRANGIWNPSAIIRDADLKSLRRRMNINPNLALPRYRRFASIQDKIKKRAFDLFRIEHAFHVAGSADGNIAVTELGTGEHGVNRATHSLVHERGG